MEADHPKTWRRAAARCPKSLPFTLLVMVTLVTGCPRNEYVVQLKPHGKVMERTLTFYRADGTNVSIGAPDYKPFDASELAAIAASYSSPIKTNSGPSYTASGEFTNAMPADVGGAGTYTNLVTSLGEAGVEGERFRGNDDLAAVTERHFKAADRLTDLVIDWSKAELGREPGYEKLRQFLDTDFRRDIKNAAAYWQAAELANSYKTNANEEFMVRFGQYLYERGYFAMSDGLAQLWAVADNGTNGLWPQVQRLVARKMGVADSEPAPASLAFLADDGAADRSFTNYLGGTEFYRARLKQWEADSKMNPKLKRPEPNEVFQELIGELVEINLFGPDVDHVVVRLTLPAPPDHSNGSWDEDLKQVVWNSNIEQRTNGMHLPVSCYAAWSQPDEAFQTAHFGKVALSGDGLIQYCVWRSGLDAKHGVEWDGFVAELLPDNRLVATINAFRFSDEKEQPPTKEPQQDTGASAFARRLLVEAVK